ncbi:hypothetical protein GCM10027053_31690 [Intrasporangium mesophilum]
MHRHAARPRSRALASLTAAILAGAGLIVTQSTAAQAIDPVCQTKNYPNFDNVQPGDLTLNGDAAIVGSPGVLRLVPSVLSSGGSSFTTQKVSFLNDGSFSTAFSFRFSNQQFGGADGMVFVVQNVANNVGTLGGGMGYQGLPLSIGVEFDSWFNQGFDSDDNHVGIDVNGDINSNPRATLNGLLTLDDPNAVHHAWVDYNGATDVLEVRISDGARPTAPILTTSIDIPATLGGVTDAFVGFTAATGAAAADHDVLDWTLINCYQPIDGPPVVTPGGPYTGTEGQPVALAGTVTDDVSATSQWTYAVTSADPGATCAFGDGTSPATTVTCTDDGTYTLTLTGTDGQNPPVSQDVTLTVVNAPPVMGTVTPTFTSACTVGVSAAFTDAGTNDTHTASIDWGDGSSSPASVTESLGSGSASATHAFTAAGTFQVRATVSDDDGGASAPGSASVTTKNTASGFGPPINAGGDRSVFRLGSTIPLKITVTDCTGALVTTLTPTVQLDKVSSVPGGPVNEAMITEVPTNGKAMRWTDDHYHYTLSTKRSEFFGGAALTSGSYRITVTDPSLFALATVYIDLA